MSGKGSSSTDGPSRVKKRWGRVRESVLMRSNVVEDGGEKGLRDSIVIDASALDKDDKGDENLAVEGLFHTPRQSVYSRLAALVMKMHHKTNGVKTINQSFRGICEIACNDTCHCKNEYDKNGVPDAFTTTALIDWLMDTLKMESHLETCHLATMLCKTGYIYPCNMVWNAITVKINEPDDTMICRFQNPYYWPTRSIPPQEIDYGSYLVARQGNNYGIPLDEFETICLTKLPKILGRQWELIIRTSEMQLKLMQECCPCDQYLKAWQEYAYWRAQRPPNYYRYLFKGISSIHGLNRNCRSLEPESKTAVNEKKKGSGSPSKIIKTSCNRIISSCVERGEADPFLVKGEKYYNPWQNDTIGDGWPNPPTEETGPYKMQCMEWGLSFDVLLRDPIGQAIFEKHLKKEFSEENLAFYRECIYLKNAPIAEVPGLVQSIFNEFILPNGETPVNIDTQTLKIVKQAIKDSKTPHVFDPALDHIYKLMKKDSYKRFLSSNIYKETLLNAIEPTKPPKAKKGLPKIWRLAQFMEKGKDEEA